MTPKRRCQLERDQTLRLTDDEVEAGYHFCIEWDGMLIHTTDKEFECCTCTDGGGPIDKARRQP